MAIAAGQSCLQGRPFLRIVGASSVIRWVVRRGGSLNRSLTNLAARKPRMAAALALEYFPIKLMHSPHGGDIARILGG